MRKSLARVVRLAPLGLLLLLFAPVSAEAQWSTFTNPLPSGLVSTCVLLTNGEAMCHELGTNRWHRLRPNSNGSYGNGPWTATAPMPDGTDTSTAGGGCAPCTYAPLYFYSGVLPDG